MSVFRSIVVIFLLINLSTTSQAVSAPASLQDDLNWQGWSDDLFTQAQQQNRFVILDLEAVWCHWCHVMEQTTYRDPEVQHLLKKHYITVRVDQDSHPGLLARYGDYGWPATIVFSADGSEIVKRRGYINPQVMASMLQAIIDDPSPGPSVFAQQTVTNSKDSSLSSDQLKRLMDRYFDLYDAENGGWGFIHKFINADAMDYALEKAHQGDKTFEFIARQTLHAALDLIDPVWGGVYQYSDQLDWQSPHFEKIMSIQTQYLRQYSLAWSMWRMDSHRAAADSIYDYLNSFLKSENGLFYTSQDADLNEQIDGHAYFILDDKNRRKLGMPRIDKNIYSRENAWIIRSFISYANATGLQQPLSQAIRMAEKVEALYLLPNGGFKHASDDDSATYLSDSLAMVQAYTALYKATGDQQWLRNAVHTLAFIEASFKNTQLGGYMNSAVENNATGVFLQPVIQRDENVQLAQIANRIYHLSGNKSLLDIYQHAMKYMTSEDILNGRFFIPGLLLANYEFNQAPVHITIVGSKSDNNARMLHNEARKYPVDYLHIDWWDKSQGRLMNDNIEYPDLKQSAAFACTKDSCSLPIFDSKLLHAQVDKLLSPLR